MNIEHNDNTPDSDAPLNAAMNSWRTPPLSPWFAERALRRMADHAATLRREAWPWPPVRLAAATAVAAALGCVLSFVLPMADQTMLGETAMNESSAVSQQVVATNADEGDDMIAQLW